MLRRTVPGRPPTGPASGPRTRKLTDGWSQRLSPPRFPSPGKDTIFDGPFTPATGPDHAPLIPSEPSARPEGHLTGPIAPVQGLPGWVTEPLPRLAARAWQSAVDSAMDFYCFFYCATWYRGLQDGMGRVP